MPRPFFALSLALCTFACSGVRDDLRRAETAFEEARYEDVEVWLADLEPSVARMEPAQRARYYYLVGMSAFRMGKRARARHALALCRAELESAPAALPPAWAHNLESALAELQGA